MLISNYGLSQQFLKNVPNEHVGEKFKDEIDWFEWCSDLLAYWFFEWGFSLFFCSTDGDADGSKVDGEKLALVKSSLFVDCSEFNQGCLKWFLIVDWEMPRN